MTLTTKILLGGAIGAALGLLLPAPVGIITAAGVGFLIGLM